MLAFDLLLDPFALLGILQVRVLHCDRAAVRVTQHTKHIAQPCEGATRESADGELAIEIPQRQAVRLDLEIRVCALAVFERIDIGHEVSARAERADEFVHSCCFVDVAVVQCRDVIRPLDRGVGDTQRCEDVGVEVIAANEVLVDPAEEFTRLRALDDAMVVGRCECDDLADCAFDEGVLGGALEFGRILECANTDDGGLSLHESRHGVHRADAAGVRQRNGDTTEVIDRQFARACAAHDVLVRDPELCEVHLLGMLDCRDEQLAGTVGLREIDRDAEVDRRVRLHRGLVVHAGVRDVHLGHVAQGADDRVRNEVCERHLATATAGEMVVDDHPVIDEQFRRNGTNARRRRHLEGGLHVRDDARRWALEFLGFAVAGRDDFGRRRHVAQRRGFDANRWCGFRCTAGLDSRVDRRVRRRGGGGGAGGAALRLVGGEEVPPRGIHRVLVLEVLLVELVYQPFIRPE